MVFLANNNIFYAISQTFTGNPSGSYTTISNYLKNTEPLPVPADGDVFTFIDNNQVRQLSAQIYCN